MVSGEELGVGAPVRRSNTDGDAGDWPHIKRVMHAADVADPVFDAHQQPTARGVGESDDRLECPVG